MRWLGLVLMLCMGCTATLPPPPVMPEPPATVAPIVPLVPERRVAPEVPLAPLVRTTPQAAYAAVAAANRGALVRPQPGWFQGSTLVYPVLEGRIYHILTKSEAPTRLAFYPPERLINVHWLQVGASPDEDAWDVVRMDREAPDRPDYVVIIPKLPQQRREFSLVTSHHAYTLLVESTAAQGLTEVQWAHPTPPVVEPPPFPPGLYYAGLTIEPVHGSPPWTPQAAWALPSENKTLVLYPPAMPRYGMPIIKAIGADGETRETMNWRVKGRYVEIDRFFHVAEVRFGHEDHAVVRIAQTSAMTAIWCPESPGCPDPALAR